MVENTVEIFDPLLQRLNDFFINSTGVARFLFTYLKQFETILNFLRATRERNFSWHLKATDQLIKYFFAHNHYNYARLLPLYLYSMSYTKDNNPQIWEELKKENFCVSKSTVPFSSIGPDHAFEHENRKLKVSGGIVGITQNEAALNRYFVTAPDLLEISNQFKDKFISNVVSKCEQHHDFSKSTAKRLKQKYLALKTVMLNHMEGLDIRSDELFNIVSGKVVDSKIAQDIIKRDELGEERYKDFVENRLIQGKTCIWSPSKRANIGTFRSVSTKKIKEKNENKLIKIVEERNLLQRLVIMSRSRSDIDLKSCIGDYEFGLVLRSLFASDGALLLPTDKSKIVSLLKDCADKLKGTKSAIQIAETGSGPDSCLLIDGMALVQRISKTDDIITCKDFYKHFLERLITKSRQYTRTYLIFDVYRDISLKNQMRTKRRGTDNTYYRVTNSTLIKNISLKTFLSNVRTKAELTKYLGEKVLEYSKSSENQLGKIVISYENHSFSNKENPEDIIHHKHERADTLLIFHAAYLTKQYGKNIRLTIESPDTDVFVLLVGMYQFLSTKLFFLTGTGKARRLIDIKTIVKAIGSEQAEALIGFHAFTGTDISGKFFGKSKNACCKLFLNTEDKSILKALVNLGSASFCDENYKSLEKFVYLIYKSKNMHNVAELRWYLYSIKNQHGENLPPTPDALRLHILRARFDATVWQKSVDCIPELPNPESHGWKLVDGVYQVIPLTRGPAPESIVHLVKCGCKKGCSGNCSCRKNVLPCSESCVCSEFECTNNDLDNNLDVSSSSDSE